MVFWVHNLTKCAVAARYPAPIMSIGEVCNAWYAAQHIPLTAKRDVVVQADWKRRFVRG